MQLYMKIWNAIQKEENAFSKAIMGDYVLVICYVFRNNILGRNYFELQPKQGLRNIGRTRLTWLWPFYHNTLHALFNFGAFYSMAYVSSACSMYLNFYLMFQTWTLHLFKVMFCMLFMLLWLKCTCLHSEVVLVKQDAIL